MKKNVLSLSIAAMFGGLGYKPEAHHETDDTETRLVTVYAGKGHNLLVPYFNAQHGNLSVFHVVNTDPLGGKAVKVRFRSASSSDDILDFREFLSPSLAQHHTGE